jgi:superfamily I DNA/RNA helicase
MLTAQALPNIWIHSFQSQIDYIKRLHSRLKTGNIDEDELNEFSDDLPKFLLKLSVEDLEKIINDIENNIVKKEDCFIEMYTIHSYKGLESDIVRIYNDIDVTKEINLNYVALTRGMKEIIVDVKIPIYDDISDGKKQTHMSKFIKPIKNIKIKKDKLPKDQIILDDFIDS